METETGLENYHLPTTAGLENYQLPTTAGLENYQLPTKRFISIDTRSIIRGRRVRLIP